MECVRNTAPAGTSHVFRQLTDSSRIKKSMTSNLQHLCQQLRLLELPELWTPFPFNAELRCQQRLDNLDWTVTEFSMI
jgi:hypothetical protein